MRVIAKKLNVRSGPSTDFRVMTQLEQEQKVDVIETVGDWSWVAPGAGWVARSWLEADLFLAVPIGLQGILSTFGPAASATASSGRAVLPGSLKLGWSDARVSRFACHARLEDIFTKVFHEIHVKGYWNLLKTFDGCYNPRKIGRTDKWSTHAWGIGVDLNGATNRQGTAGDMPANIIRIFEENGFVWGGRWQGASRDPMHFQYADRY